MQDDGCVSTSHHRDCAPRPAAGLHPLLAFLLLPPPPAASGAMRPVPPFDAWAQLVAPSRCSARFPMSTSTVDRSVRRIESPQAWQQARRRCSHTSYIPVPSRSRITTRSTTASSSSFNSSRCPLQQRRYRASIRTRSFERMDAPLAACCGSMALDPTAGDWGRDLATHRIRQA